MNSRLVSFLAILLVGALIGTMSDGSVSFGQSGGGTMKRCKSHASDPPTVDDPVCTITITADPSCDPQGFRVTASSCSPRVTTYPDDACDGNPDPCNPPHTTTQAKTISQAAVPNLHVNDCTSNPPNCVCGLTGTYTYTGGRKVC